MFSRIRMQILTAIGCFAISQGVHAAIAPGLDTTPLSRSLDFSSLRRDFSKGFDASTIQPMESVNTIHSDDVARVIPSDLKDKSSSSNVMAKIVDHSVSSFMNSERMKSSDLGRVTTRVQDKMKTNVEFGGAEPNTIHHSVKFEVRAAEQKALMTYTGYTNAAVTYQPGVTNVELFEPVASLGTKVVFDYTVKPGDSRDVVSMRWNW